MAMLLTISIDKFALQCTMAVTFIVFLKCMATAMCQGHNRFKTGFRPPEDMGLGMSKGVQSFGLTPKSDEAKAKRAIQTETR
jgi:hypothetical protein